jgi:hypothetical protein
VRSANLRPVLNPLNFKTVLLAKHAQHVALIPFPIALFIAGVAFALIAQWTRRRGLADAAYYNLLVAAISTLPVLRPASRPGSFNSRQKLKGILLLHLAFACVAN